MNGWSLLGLETALLAQNRKSEASAITDLFKEAWARSDTWITAPVF